MTDVDLMTAVASGSQPAMATIFDRYQDCVLGVAMSSLRDRDSAMDVLSEVMLAVWRRAHTFQGRSTARTWILGIAIHKILDQQRLRARMDPAGDGTEKPDDPGSAPIEPRMPAERLALQRCLGKLPAAQRQALHLAFYEDLPCAEIADALRVPVGTVRSRIHYAARVLRRCLERQGVS